MRSKVLLVVMAAALVGAVLSVVPAGASTDRGGSLHRSSPGDPIKVGVTYMCDAPTPPALCEIAPSAQAAAKTLNSKGGVKTADGETHQVKVILCNNKNDRATIADCARQFVDEKVTFATGAALYGDEVVPILAAGGVSYFAPTCASDCNAEATSKNAYLTSFTLGLFEGLTQELTDAGFKKMNVVAQGTGVGLGALTKPIAEAGGATLEVVEAADREPELGADRRGSRGQRRRHLHGDGRARDEGVSRCLHPGRQGRAGDERHRDHHQRSDRSDRWRRTVP